MDVKIRTIDLHHTVAGKIKQHSHEQDAKGKYEAVGFVARICGTDLATATVQLNNHANNPTEAYFVEPWEQFRAESKLKAQGYSIVGVYHSHVNSEALPSQSDHKLARPGEYAFIYSVVFEELKAYYYVDNFLEPVQINYVEEAENA